MDANDPRFHWKHDGDLPAVAAHLRQCAESWEPGARLVGNCRACDIAEIAAGYAEYAADMARAYSAVNAAILYMGDASQEMSEEQFLRLREEAQSFLRDTAGFVSTKPPQTGTVSHAQASKDQV